jgi:hypothetical protein
VLALAVLACSLLINLSAGRAEASTAYRYWAFYVASGSSWNYSSRGPVAEHPADGEVQGWRFAVQADTNGELRPRETPNFQQLCRSTPPIDGKLRVGIVLDFGTPADAPPNEKPPAQVVTGCVQVEAGASGADVLQAAVGAGHLRVGNTGLVCGIDGYPKTECAPAVDISRTTTTPAATSTTPAAAPVKSTVAKTPASATAAKPANPPTQPSSQTPATQAKTPAPSTLDPTSSAAVGSPPAVAGSTPLSSLHQQSASSGGFPLAAVAGAVLVIGLGVAAAVKARR